MFAVFVNKGSANSPIYVPTIFKGHSAAIAFRTIQVDSAFIRELVDDCDRCLRLDPSDVSHFNCIYHGQAIGHSHNGHCTATACF